MLQKNTDDYEWIVDHDRITTKSIIYKEEHIQYLLSITDPKLKEQIKIELTLPHEKGRFQDLIHTHCGNAKDILIHLNNIHPSTLSANQASSSIHLQMLWALMSCLITAYAVYFSTNEDNKNTAPSLGR